MKGENAEIKLAAGAEITVTTDPLFKDQCDESHLWIDYSNLVKVMEVGKRILISDGLIALVVLEKGDTLATNCRTNAATCHYGIIYRIMLLPLCITDVVVGCL